MDTVTGRAGGPRRRATTAATARRRSSETPRDPRPIALEYARDAARRIRSRPAPVRVGFIERLKPSDPDPPLAQILRGGQGGAVRLKVLLSLLWFSVRFPHETNYPSRGWASLLDLDEPETNGARRVNAAISWLANHRYLRITPNPGAPSTIYLRDERGLGIPYRLPAKVIKDLKETNERISRDEYWVQLPASFWTNGWIGILSGAAVAMLLVMLDEAAGSGQTTGLWHSPRMARERFGLSQDTRTDGLLELEACGILDMRRSPVSPGVFDYRRLRNVYDLHLEQLEVSPGTPRPRKLLAPERPDHLDIIQLEKLLEEVSS